MLEELIQPFVADGVEEATYVSVQQPIHLLFRETNPKCVECIVAPASGPMPVAETEEVRLVDAFEHRLHGLLHDFVLQGCYAQGTLPSIRFGNPGPFGRLCPIRAAVNTAVKIGEPIFQPIRVVSPRHVVDAGSRLTVEVQETRLEQFGREVVEQCGEPHPFVPTCRFPHTVKAERPDSPALCPVHGQLRGVPLGRTPSLHRLRRRRRAGFVRLLPWYYETVRLPGSVRVGWLVSDLPQPSRVANRRGNCLGLPVPVL